MARLLLLAVLLSCLAAPSAIAASASPDTIAIPDPAQSTFQDRLGRSPRNIEVANPTFQYTYRGRLIMSNGVPIVGWPANDIQLRINTPCQNPIALVPDGPSNFSGEVVWGAAKLDQAGGGACTGQAVVEIRLLSIGVFKRLSEVTSPDQDGDGLVALPDFTAFQQAFVSGGPQFRGDLDLSGGPPDLADLQFFQRHFTALP